MCKLIPVSTWAMFPNRNIIRGKGKGVNRARWEVNDKLFDLVVKFLVRHSENDCALPPDLHLFDVGEIIYEELMAWLEGPTEHL